QDSVILERLVRAARRGVKVHVMARPPHSLKQDQLIEGVGGLRILDDVGVKVRKLKGLKLHGKMLLADGVTAIVGSIKLAPASFAASHSNLCHPFAQNGSAPCCWSRWAMAWSPTWCSIRPKARTPVGL